MAQMVTIRKDIYMEEKITKERFMELCAIGGYCTAEQAEEYAGDRVEFTVHDIVNVYKINNKFYNDNN